MQKNSFKIPTTLSTLALLAGLSACNIQVGDTNRDPNFKPDETTSTRSFDLKQVYTISSNGRTDNYFFLASTLENSPIYSLVKVEMWDVEDQRRIEITDRFVTEIPVSSSTLAIMENRDILSTSTSQLIRENRGEVAYLESSRLYSLARPGTTVSVYFTFTRMDGSQTTQEMRVAIL